MSRIWFTSDLHFCHDREFLYKPRGFTNVWDMNRCIVDNWNAVVRDDDDVYVLGDIMLNNNDEGMRLLGQLRGRIHIVTGNHDTATRIGLYNYCHNVVEVAAALYVNYKGYHFYCTHYPCVTGYLEQDDLKKMTCNLFGHTHQTTNFYNDMPFMYHVGVDSHECKPVLIDDIIDDMNAKMEECKRLL